MLSRQCVLLLAVADPDVADVEVVFPHYLHQLEPELVDVLPYFRHVVLRYAELFRLLLLVDNVPEMRLCEMVRWQMANA